MTEAPVLGRARRTAGVEHGEVKAGEPSRRTPIGVVLPYALLGGVFLLLVRLAARPLTNMDTYFHLRYGREFLHGDWSLRNPGSVSTYGTAHWVPTQWLPEVVMAQLEEWFGLAGVAWLAGVLFLTLATTVFLVARRWTTPWLALAILVFTLIACAPGMSMRPQQLSYLLVLVTAAAWVRSRSTGRAPWVLVPMTFVWTMCHGMWPVGILIGAGAVTGLVIDGRIRGPQVIRFGAVPIASALVAALTPVGPGLFGAVLLVNSRGHYFSEWAPPTFTTAYGLALLALLALAAIPRLRRGGVSWFEIALIGLAAGLGVYSTRTLPVAACLLVPLVASGLRAEVPGPGVSRRERLLVWGGAVVAAGVLVTVVPHTSAQPPPQPAWEAHALGSLPPGTTVLSESLYGGYLMWRYPNLDLVAHGYGDAFTDRELQRNVKIEQMKPGWLDLVKATHVQYAVVDPDSQLGYALIQVEHWQVVHADPDRAMLRPPPGW